MFSLLEIFVKKINFNLIREKVLKCEQMKIESKVDVNGKYNRKIKIMEVMLGTTIKGFENDLSILNINLELIGIFGENENNNGDIDGNALELFTKIKAPSIMYPFLLENIYSVTLKAKIKPIIVPYIDFKKLYFDSKNFKIVH